MGHVWKTRLKSLRALLDDGLLNFLISPCKIRSLSTNALPFSTRAVLEQQQLRPLLRGAVTAVLAPSCPHSCAAASPPAKELRLLLNLGVVRSPRALAR